MDQVNERGPRGEYIIRAADDQLEINIDDGFTSQTAVVLVADEKSVRSQQRGLLNAPGSH